DQRVLGVDADRKHRDWIVRIARSIAATVEIADASERSLDATAYDLVVIHRDGLPAQRRVDLLEQLRASRQRTHPLLIASANEGYLGLFQELRSYGLTNLLAKNEEVDSIELIVTMQKILSE